jgi:hypothetical protein
MHVKAIRGLRENDIHDSIELSLSLPLLYSLFLSLSAALHLLLLLLLLCCCAAAAVLSLWLRVLI